LGHPCLVPACHCPHIPLRIPRPATFYTEYLPTLVRSDGRLTASHPEQQGQAWPSLRWFSHLLARPPRFARPRPCPLPTLRGNSFLRNTVHGFMVFGAPPLLLSLLIEGSPLLPLRCGSGKNRIHSECRFLAIYIFSSKPNLF